MEFYMKKLSIFLFTSLFCASIFAMEVPNNNKEMEKGYGENVKSDRIKIILNNGEQKEYIDRSELEIFTHSKYIHDLLESKDLETISEITIPIASLREFWIIQDWLKEIHVHGEKNLLELLKIQSKKERMEILNLAKSFGIKPLITCLRALHQELYEDLIEIILADEKKQCISRSKQLPIFTSCSAWFENLLRFNPAEDILEIDLSDFSLKAFLIIQNLSEEIYTEKNLFELLKIQSEQEIVEILNLADFFGIEPLIDACFQVLIEKFSNNCHFSLDNEDAAEILNPYLQEEIIAKSFAKKLFYDYKGILKEALNRYTKYTDISAYLATDLIGIWRYIQFRSATFSPDNNLLVATSLEGPIKICNCSNPDNIVLLKDLNIGNHEWAPSVAFHPSSKIFLVTYSNGSVQIYDYSNLNNIILVKTINDHTDFAKSVAFSPDGKIFITTSVDENARVRVYNCSDLSNIDNIKLIATLNDHKQMVKSVAFSPNAKIFVTVSGDKTARIYDYSGLDLDNIDATAIKLIKTFDNYTAPVISTMFSPDGKLLVTNCYDGSMQIYNCTDQNNIQLVTTLAYAHSAAFIPDSKILVTVSGGGSSIKIYNCHDGYIDLIETNGVSCNSEYKDELYTISWSPNGNLLFLGSRIYPSSWIKNLIDFYHESVNTIDQALLLEKCLKDEDYENLKKFLNL
jgi:6-phosphogluconolactonase (cycloisomerase 2 family)